MKTHKRILKNIAKNYKIDPDEILIAIWDHPEKKTKFDYLKNENSVVKSKDLNFVKEIILSKLKGTDKKSTKKIKPIELIIKDHDFYSIGKINDQISHITKDEILKIHEELTMDFEGAEDPIDPPGVKNISMLESALFHPQTSYDGQNKYPNVESAAAALMYSLSSNHGFHNGNKRASMVAMLVFLDRHGLCLNCNEDELFKKSMLLAKHELVEEKSRYPDAEIHELSSWISKNSKVMEKGERPITLNKFKKILSRFNCTILDSGKVERIIYVKNFIGAKKPKILTSKKAIVGTISDGHEVDRNLIKSIRKDLELDSEHAIDGKVFYEEEEFSSSEFIIRYQNPLKRLSRV